MFGGEKENEERWLESVDRLERVIGLMSHHDVITGTSRQSV